ncbi:MAG: ATP-binding cassette domain-containing protein [Thermovirgaceae bacterium]|nr:ATP-binding cassette domain-containing protein [Thermovirgaceae bacterium]
MTSIYELSNVTQSYAGRTILDIRNMKIVKGSILGITGPNGSGKSTLLRILAFLEKPGTGKVFFKGKAVREIGEDLRREATLLLQESRLLKRSVFDNVAYGLRARGLVDHLRENVAQALSQVGLDPGQFAGRAWFELSGGEAQRVALASRIVLKPKVLLLDEPTASIDIQSARIIAKAILEARENLDTTVIIVSHDLEWAYSASDEIISMHSGRIHSRGPENILQGPWENCGENMVCRRLDDGQTVTVRQPSPSPSTETALLDPEDIILSKAIPEHISARNTITGNVVRMNLENGKGSVLVTVLAGGQTFTSRITSDSLARLNLVPGSPIALLFKATAIRWV